MSTNPSTSPNVSRFAHAPLLRATAVPILLAPEQFTASFYRRVFERAPGLRVLFSSDMQAQQLKLAQMLAAVLNLLDDLPTLIPKLRAMGATHLGYGAKPQHYQVIVEAMLESLIEANAGQLAESAIKAWSDLLTMISQEMLKGANQQKSLDKPLRGIHG